MLSSAEIWAEVDATFGKYDADGNGQLDLEEATKYISDWCKKKGLSAEEAHIVSTFEDIDADGDGYLSKEELFNFIKDQKALHSEIFEVKYSENYKGEGDHPLHGRFFKLKNVHDNGRGPENTWISFRDSDLAYRSIYDENDGVTWRFYMVEGKPNVYKVKQYWKNKVYWVSLADDGAWIYGRYSNEADAMPIYFEKCAHNLSQTFTGECYVMKNLFTPYAGGHWWLSFTDNGSWMRAVYY